MNKLTDTSYLPALVILLLFATLAQADTPALQLLAQWSGQPAVSAGTRAWRFARYPSYPVLFITQLGVADSGGDGLANAHEVGLWNQIRIGTNGYLTGTLLASVTVPAGTAAPLVAGYRWVAIPPVRIPADLSTYLIGAQYAAGDADNMVTPLTSALNFVVPIDGFTQWGYYQNGSTLAFPCLSTDTGGEHPSGPTFFEANFQFSYTIPESSASVLLGLGSLCLLGARRWLGQGRAARQASASTRG